MHVVNFYSYIYKFSTDDLYRSRSDCADTGLSNAIPVYGHICACPNKTAQRYRCSHVHLVSKYYVVIKPAFCAQMTCVRQTSGKLTPTSDLLSPLVIFENFLLTRLLL